MSKKKIAEVFAREVEAVRKASPGDGARIGQLFRLEDAVLRCEVVAVAMSDIPAGGSAVMLSSEQYEALVRKARGSP
jgi:predicted RecA/RadA family phage recombinase